MDEVKLIAAIVAMAGVIWFLINWILNRVSKNIDEQTKTNVEIRDSIKTIAENMRQHSEESKLYFEENTKALKEHTKTVRSLAKTQNKMCEVMVKCSNNGTKPTGVM